MDTKPEPVILLLDPSMYGSLLMLAGMDEYEENRAVWLSKQILSKSVKVPIPGMVTSMALMFDDLLENKNKKDDE